MPKDNPVFESAFETYTPSKVIGEGGSGRVFSVSDSAGKPFALKCLSRERISTEKLKRFKNEIDFCRRTNHPHIVSIQDSGVLQDEKTKCPFYVMPLYPDTLRSALNKVSPEDKLRLFAQILDGVEAAHLSGVWHRDLKPENILVDLKSMHLVVADFGIAHFEEEAILTAVETRKDARMANFQYSAPEQRARGAKVDHRADIYALGLILNELFTGHIPQGAGYPRIANSHPNLAYLDDLVEAMIQQDPLKRPSTVLEIKKELIGRKLAFVALQEFEESKKAVVPISKPSVFEPLTIVGLDFDAGTLTLKLSADAPPQWGQVFRSPRGGYSSIHGYGPERFEVRGNSLSIGVGNNERLIQQLVDHSNTYVEMANKGYQVHLNELAAAKEREQRRALEKRTADAELKKNILSRIKL